jgi:hypothetical protein
MERTAIANAVDSVLPAVMAVFPSFASTSLSDLRVRLACSTILQLLIDFRDDVWLSLFETPRSFFSWFGALCVVDHREYAALCAAISRSQIIREVILSDFIKCQRVPFSTQALRQIAPVAGFVAPLFQAAAVNHWTLDPLDLEMVIFRACEAIPLGEDHWLRLVLAVCRFFAGERSPAYAERFFCFRNAVMCVFGQPLEPSRAKIALSAMACLFRLQTEGEDFTDFGQMFMGKLLNYMGCVDPPVRKHAWGIFGNWVHREDRPLELLLATECFRSALSGLLALAPGIPECSARVLLMLEGFVEAGSSGVFRKTRAEKRKKKVREFLAGVIAKEKVAMSRFVEGALAPGGMEILEKSKEALRMIDELAKRYR